MKNKKKILMISDHAYSPSGVGVQSKYLIEGLLKKQKYSFIQLGCALKHYDYRTMKVSEDFVIKPIDGFGNPNLLRTILLKEQPDALIIFSDPRFFTWLFEIEDEVRSVCPILWWHVWDNLPYPEFNEWMYKSVDAINCHSYLTYKMCKDHFPDKTSFIPHAIPKNVFHRLDKDLIKEEKVRILGKKRSDNFICLWMNRNCKRKRPGDVLYSWKLFVDMISKSERDKVTLLMHTNPEDKAGSNLYKIAESLGILDTLTFSTEVLGEDLINVLHNISDICLNISFNEGFGLTTLESMQVGNPIVVSKTGGLYRQVIDYKDRSMNGIGLEPKIKTLVGSQNIPYIFEDYVSCEEVSIAIKCMFRLSKREMRELSLKVEKYALEEFAYDNTIDLWDNSITNYIDLHKLKKKNSDIKLISL